jgi:hypothetical protein
MEQNWSTRWIVPTFACEFCADDSLDIFQENKGRSATLDSIEDCWEEVSPISIGGSSTCC